MRSQTRNIIDATGGSGPPLAKWVLAIAAIALFAITSATPLRATLAPVSDSSLTLVRPDGTIAYDDTGGVGPVLICVPDMGDLRQQYRMLTPRLVADGFRVIAMDLRGMGGSSAVWPTYSPQSIGSDILAMVDHIGVARAFVVASGYAGGAAVIAAAKSPNQIAGLILIDPFVHAHHVTLLTRLKLHFTLHRPWGPSLWVSHYRSLYKMDPPPDLDDYIVELKDNLEQKGRFESLEAMVWSSQAASAARMADVRCPVLVVMGEDDPDFIVPAAEADWLKTHLHAQIVTVPNVGHYPHVEKPRVVAQAIVAFVKQNSQGH